MNRMLMLCLMLCVATSSSACYRVVQPKPGAPTPEQPVQASFGRTWDAVIDYFAEQNITIETIERASGIIVASPARIGSFERGTELADCGSLAGLPFAADRVGYNVRVKGDSTRSVMRVNTRFITGEPRILYDCTSRGVLEKNITEAVRANAERK